MKGGFNFDDLKFNYQMKQLDNELADIKSEINKNLDVYFIEDNKMLYDSMMKEYTGGNHVVYKDESKTDFTKYNEYSNPFVKKFNKY